MPSRGLKGEGLKLRRHPLWTLVIPMTILPRRLDESRLPKDAVELAHHSGVRVTCLWLTHTAHLDATFFIREGVFLGRCAETS